MIGGEDLAMGKTLSGADDLPEMGHLDRISRGVVDPDIDGPLDDDVRDAGQWDVVERPHVAVDLGTRVG